LVALAALVTPALSDEQAGEANPMASYRLPKAPAEGKDKKEILAVFRKMEVAEKKADIEAAAALVDFPVLMATDDSKGEAQSGAWTRDQWMEVMKPFYAKPMDTKMTHQMSVFVVTDSLAVAHDHWKMTMGKKAMSGRNSTLFVRKGGEWKVKALMEGGWGDMPMPAQEAGSN
jgi:hypothetical protein